MKLEDKLKQLVVEVVQELYAQTIDDALVKIDKTPQEFHGELTVVIFPIVKISRKNPEITANEIGQALQNRSEIIESYNVVKGFLNISFSEAFWLSVLKEISATNNFGEKSASGKKYVVEYCGPNTNKPLHLGHVRNVLLGYSVANILLAAGHEVHKVNILNDRGIAICKSMVAYKRTGNEETPASTEIKGDHFVGKYYVEYQRIFEQEVGLLEMSNISKEDAEKTCSIYLEASEMLRDWEAGDPAVIELWNTMNNWVYAGFEETYKKIGIDFEKDYKESEYYLKGKDIVYKGLEKNAFYKKDDGSIWVDLTEEGLDHKVLLRADGTSVYITQDIAVAIARYADFKMDTSIYVVANEQDYHFKVLKLVLQKLSEPFADGIYHLNYGMVDLPEGKMKSREGTVVDADELIDEMQAEAREFLSSSEKLHDFSEEEKNILADQIGLAALKYFILKVDPKKRILFNPKESIDLQGNTGPFIQYTYARIQSIFRKLKEENFQISQDKIESLDAIEKELIVLLNQYPTIVEIAADTYSPAEVANYIYGMAKKFNTFYVDHSISKAESEAKKHLRANIALNVSGVIKHGLNLLGISVPERM